MVHFQSVDVKVFLTEYWQKKPLVIRQALPDFINPLSADELAGLALEEDVESRMVFEMPSHSPSWRLKRGPFTEADFATLPKTHWTLLVQGVDLLIPEVASLLNHFDFIPQWRLDDVMISYAVKHGSVGPHYDNYDVFLYQAKGQRKWSLTTQQCHEANYLKKVDLRIMETFEVEEEFILLPGDMLYLPPHVGHHGVSLDDECMTYSFGYRSYQAQELWESFADYLAEKNKPTDLYQDPNWATLEATSCIPPQAWRNAKDLMQDLLTDETRLQTWFGCFATRLDQSAEQRMPEPLDEDGAENLQQPTFLQELLDGAGLLRDATCRMAYLPTGELFINGTEWPTDGVSSLLIKQVADHRLSNISTLKPFLTEEANQCFLYDLWKLQWLEIA
ncbi:MAG: cupin domain-containing protein [Legionellales bacterium]|nr:cupin domain-containing protein [Legionellales bacterium]